jgi:fatty-acyl-CoA synthase
MSSSYARGGTTVPLLEETIGANLDRIVERFADRDALVSRAQGLRFSYRQLGAAVDELARALIAAGLANGDRLGIWSPNCAEWTLVQYATAKLGVILVNINPAYRTSELEYSLRQSGCRMLIAAPAYKTSDYRAMVAEVGPGLDALERVVFLGGEEWTQLLESAAGVEPGQLRARSGDGDGQPRLHHARGGDGHPGARVRARGDARGLRGRALQLPVRGADDVHRPTRPSPLR